MFYFIFARIRPWTRRPSREEYRIATAMGRARRSGEFGINRAALSLAHVVEREEVARPRHQGQL